MSSRVVEVIVCTLLFANPLQGRDEAIHTEGPEDHSEFLQAGEWWNLFFAEANDPLSSVKAVKVVRVSETHPSWVRIAFPRNRKEHASIFGPAAKAHDDDSIDLNAALAEWEQTVSEWRVIWINLRFVVHMSKVGPPAVPGTTEEPSRSGS